jgi:hypothetical protein
MNGCTGFLDQSHLFEIILAIALLFEMTPVLLIVKFEVSLLARSSLLVIVPLFVFLVVTFEAKGLALAIGNGSRKTFGECTPKSTGLIEPSDGGGSGGPNDTSSSLVVPESEDQDEQE